MRIITLLFCLLLGTCVRAQIGQNPPEVDWKKIDTKVGRVIFPEGYEARAKRVATFMELLEAKHNRSIGEQHYPFDLVLRTYDMTTNAYVGLAPFRSEFFTTPPQSLNRLSNADWVDLLTIHEYRHVQQNSNERRGITKLFSFLQGQNGWGVLSGIATPNWFSEGDAVIAETALTASGRGRTPRFSQTLRSILREDIEYSYAKARNGSFKDFVPDHYRYGYAMQTYARERYGNDFWRSILQDGAAYKSLIYPFSRALKKKSGMNTRQLYERTMMELATRQDSALAVGGELITGKPLGQDFRTPTSYRFPYLDGEGRLLALRSGFKHTPALVVVDPAGGKDEVVTRVGIQREPYVYVRENLATWMETRQHPRYNNKNYSEIVVFELRSGRKRILTERGKYLSPSFSFDRRTLVAVEDDPQAGVLALVLFDVVSGQETGRFPLETITASYPRFSPDGGTIYYYDRDYRGVAIQALDVASGAVRTVSKRSAESRDWLQVTEAGQLIYSSGRSGVENIYQLNPLNGEVRQLTREAIGAILPHVTEVGNLYYAAPTPRGLRLRKLELGQKNTGGSYIGIEGGTSAAGPSVFERPAAFAEEAVDLSSTLVAKDFPVDEYADNLSGLKLHSWAFNGSLVEPGFIVEADNVLRTLSVEADTRYNLNEERVSGGIAASYAGWYPVITLRGRFSDRSFGTLDAARDTFVFRGQAFNQVTVGVDASVPLRWVSGEFRTLFQPQIGYTQFGLSKALEGSSRSNFGALNAGLAFSSIRRRAVQQVMPRLGVSLSVNYGSVLADQLGSRLLVNSSLFLPGLGRTHGLRLSAAYQREEAGNTYQFSDGFRYSRGYSAPINDQVFRFSADYQLPLLYPDFGIAGITYFKRIRLNAFYDFSRYEIEQFRNFAFNERSVGGELYFDNTWLNALEVTVGVQLAYRLDRDLFSADGNDLQYRILIGSLF